GKLNTYNLSHLRVGKSAYPAQIPQRGTCKRKEDPQNQPEHTPAPKKPRLVFTDLQRRTLQAIFKETKRPSKEMQVTIARQLGLEPTTVGNFFMNARRRSMDKWKDEDPNKTTVSCVHLFLATLKTRIVHSIIGHQCAYFWPPS
ncbi:hypothetical protein L9F63_023522, partial [Diploptera punctata]